MDSNLTLDLLSDKAEHFEAVSVGDWSWLCPCSPSTIIWHMQCFALLQALRHWSKEWALTGPGNNRNKGTNDFVPTPAWCLPLSHHGLSAYWLHPAFSLSIFYLSFLHTHPHSNSPTPLYPSITLSLCSTTQIFFRPRSATQAVAVSCSTSVLKNQMYRIQAKNVCCCCRKAFYQYESNISDVNIIKKPKKQLLY